MSEFESEVLGLEHVIEWVTADNAPAIRWNIENDTSEDYGNCRGRGWL